MIICITGSSGVGKTTILKILSTDFKVEFLDNKVHEIYQKNQIGYKLIQKNFGNDYVDKFSVNRKKLGSLVFNDKQALKKLDEIMFPIIQDMILKIKKENLDSIVLVEAGAVLNNYDKYTTLFDQFILITAPKERIIYNNKIKFNYLKNDLLNFLETNIKNKKFHLVIHNDKDPIIAAENIKDYLNNIK